MSSVQLDDVIRVMEKTLKVKPQEVSLGSRRGDLAAWDSLGHIMLVEAIGKEFAVQISPDEALQMESVQDILTVLKSK